MNLRKMTTVFTPFKYCLYTSKALIRYLACFIFIAAMHSYVAFLMPKKLVQDPQ